MCAALFGCRLCVWTNRACIDSFARHRVWSTCACVNAAATTTTAAAATTAARGVNGIFFAACSNARNGQGQ